MPGHQTGSNITPYGKKASAIAPHAMGEHRAGLTVALAITDDETNRDLKRIVQAIKDGVPAFALKDDMPSALDR